MISFAPTVHYFDPFNVNVKFNAKIILNYEFEQDMRHLSTTILLYRNKICCIKGLLILYLNVNCKTFCLFRLIIN